MANFGLLECFATFHNLPILERSIAARRAFSLMIILRVEVVDLLYPPSFSLFHELSTLERSIAVRWACLIHI